MFLVCQEHDGDISSHHINNSQFIHLRVLFSYFFFILLLLLLLFVLAGVARTMTRMMKKCDKVINALLNIFFKR